MLTGVMIILAAIASPFIILSQLSQKEKVMAFSFAVILILLSKLV